MSMPSVFDVTQAILSEFEYGLPTMKLQKLTYLAHGWYLGIFREPLSDTEFEAWEYGPVSRELYNVHKDMFSITTNELSKGSVINLDERRQKTIHIVVQQYGVLNSDSLSDFTRKPNTPWDKTALSEVIPNELIEEYFRTFLQNELRDKYHPKKIAPGITWYDLKNRLDAMSDKELHSPALLFDDRTGTEIPIRHLPSRFDGDKPFSQDNRYSITYNE